MFPRRMDQDGSHARCRAKTWGIDPRRGKNKRNVVKIDLRQENWDVDN